MKTEHIVLLALAGVTLWYLFPPEGHVTATSTVPVIPNASDLVRWDPIMGMVDFSGSTLHE